MSVRTGPGCTTTEPATSTLRVDVTPHRYELKMVLATRFLADVRAWVHVHPAHWRRTYPPRQVNNTYFDTPTYGSLQANLGGTSDRAKLRLRWYGEPVAHVSGSQLELKRKCGTTGWKEIVPVDAELDLGNQTWSDLIRVLGLSAGTIGYHWLAHFPVPVLINHYRREYYATPDEVLRLTVDRAMRAYSQRITGSPNLDIPSRLRDAVVIELKAPVTPEGLRRLNDALGAFPSSIERMSKYVTGVLASTTFR